MRAPGAIAVLATQKNSHSPEQIHLCRIADKGTRSRPGKGSLRRNHRDASSNGLVPLDQTMQPPLTLAGRLRTTFADVVSSPLPGRLAALVSRLQADRNERSGEQRKSGMQ